MDEKRIQHIAGPVAGMAVCGAILNPNMAGLIATLPARSAGRSTARSAESAAPLGRLTALRAQGNLRLWRPATRRLSPSRLMN